jgi:RND superfamily putative drug exporter
MTIVPAVLALAGQHAWHIPRWLDRVLPDLDIEGTSLRRPPAPPAEQPHAAEGIYQQRAQRS